jgi:hypothetical protein
MNYLSVSFLLVAHVVAQDSQLLTQPPADWSPPVKREVELVPLSVNARQCFHQDGRVITVEECDAPLVEPTVKKLETRAIEPTAEEIRQFQEAVPPVRVWLTAKVVTDAKGKELTLLTAKVGEDTCTVWSNLNYNYVQGAHRFEAHGIEYAVDALGLSLYSTEKIDVAPVSNKELYSTTEANIVLTERVSQNNAAYIALEDLHTMYNENVERLKLAYEKREQNKAQHAAWEEANPEEPKDITIQFWKREVSK